MGMSALWRKASRRIKQSLAAVKRERQSMRELEQQSADRSDSERASNGDPDENVRRELHVGLEHLEIPDLIGENSVEERPVALQPDNRLLNLPAEIVQIIAWKYLPWSAEAALALTCRRMRNTVGTRSWTFHDDHVPACTECALHNNVQNEDIYGPFLSSKERFLDLLVRDMPRGSAIVCLFHDIIHRVPNLKARSDDERKVALADVCDIGYNLPIGGCWGPGCTDVQLATLGVLPAESINYYAKCHGTRSGIRSLRSDVTVYGKIINGSFVLALQFRVWIPRCGHVPLSAGECVTCYRDCLQNINWVDEHGHDRSLCVPLWSNNPADWHGKELVVRQAHMSQARHVARTTVRIEHTREEGVMVLFDVFSDLQRGLRPHRILGNGEAFVAVPAWMRLCDCEPCRGRRKLETIVLEHFQDHRERLDQLRPVDALVEPKADRARVRDSIRRATSSLITRRRRKLSQS